MELKLNSKGGFANRAVSMSQGGGNVFGPSSSVDNQIARAKGTGGKEIDYSPATADDNGSINIPSGETYKINGTPLSKTDVGLGNVDNTSDATKNSATATLTNKTIDVDNNTISNVEVDNFKSGVLDTDLSNVSSLDDTLASAKAIKTYVDTKVIRETGMLVMSIASSVSGALKFDGVSSYSKTTYSALYALISSEVGTAYDVDSNNFYLPNASGRVLGIAGQGSGLTLRDIFASVGSETNNTILNHTHDLKLRRDEGSQVDCGFVPDESFTYSFSRNVTNSSQDAGKLLTDRPANTVSHITENSGSATEHSIMQPSLFAGKNLFIYY